MARADIRPASLGIRIRDCSCSVRFWFPLAFDSGKRGEVKGRAFRVKTSPETRMGSLSPNVDVRISRASTLIGVLEGVDLVLGWMVRKSMCLSCSGPRTVVIKSIVFLDGKGV